MNHAKRITLSIVVAMLVAAPVLAAGQQGAEAIVGEWEMVTEFQGQQIAATMTITLEDGELVGTWASMGQEIPMREIKVDGKTLTFNREMGQGGATLSFEGTVEGDEITGKWVSEMGELPVSGKRKS